MTARLLILYLLFLSPDLLGQVIIDNTITEVQAVEEILLGSGIEVSNITYSGDQNQIGSFDANGSNLTIPSGVILGTGNVNLASGNADFADPDAPGPGGNTQDGATSEGGNWDVGDADLAILSGQDLHDAVILEFDFVPQGDSLKFEFVFGSEEYLDFVDAGFNDAFGFFLSGPGLNGTFSNNAVNLAVVPGTTTPITINSINDADNAIYFVNNDAINNDQNIIEFDGFTTSLLAESEVQCGETYHIKIVIADGGDTSLDSAVMLEASSFSSNLFNLELVQDLGFAANDSTLFENCGQPVIRITRPAGLTDEQTLTLSLTGSAENGVDYEGIPNEVIFQENENALEIPLNIINDGISEPLEFLTLSFETVSQCSSATSEFTVYIQDLEPLNASLDDANSDCNNPALLIPEVNGGVGTYSYLWSDGSTLEQNEVSPGVTTIYTVTISDVCELDPVTVQAEVTVPEYPPIEIESLNDTTIQCEETVDLTGQATGGNGGFVYEWTFNGVILATEENINFTPSEEGVLELTVTDECNLTEQESLVISYSAISVDLGEDFNIDCLDDFEIIPSTSNDPSSFDYNWTIDNISVSSEPTYSGSANSSDLISLTVTNSCGQSTSDELMITLNQSPIEISLPEDFGICLSDSISITGSATGGVGVLSFLWIEEAISGNSLELAPASTETYTLGVSDQCENYWENQITVFVEDLEAGFNFDINEDVIEFTNTTSGSSDIFWDLDEGNSSTEENFFHSFNDPYSEHTVTLIANSELGCIDSVSHTFYPPPLLYIPNSFTPDGDGLNEAFKVIGSSLSTFHLWIYDRDGHLVFETENILEPWDGSNMRGDYYVQDGIYTYVLRAKTLGTDVLEQKGSITVLR